MLYLDTFVTEVTDAFNYPVVLVDIICNTCYQGIDEFTPDLGMNLITQRLKLCTAKFFMNSLYGVYEVLLNLVDFLIICTDISPDESRYQIPLLDVKRMTELLTKYKKTYSVDYEMSYSMERHHAEAILTAIKEDLVERLTNLVEEVQEKQGDYTVCERFFTKDSFFEDACLLIRELLTDGFFNRRETMETRIHTYYSSSETERFPQIMAIRHRPRNEARPEIRATSSDLHILKDLYSNLNRADAEQARNYFNRALIFSGIQSERFVECLQTTNDEGRTPHDFVDLAFFNFERILNNSDLMHDIDDPDDFRLTADVYRFIREGLVNFRERIRGVPEPTPELGTPTTRRRGTPIHRDIPPDLFPRHAQTFEPVYATAIIEEETTGFGFGYIALGVMVVIILLMFVM